MGWKGEKVQEEQPPDLRRAGGRGTRDERDGVLQRFQRSDGDSEKTYCTHAYTHIHIPRAASRGIRARMSCAFFFALSFSPSRSLSLSFSLSFSFSLTVSGSRALLRHHEYLIIMSVVTSESPPSDSSQAEFHR